MSTEIIGKIRTNNIDNKFIPAILYNKENNIKIQVPNFNYCLNKFYTLNIEGKIYQTFLKDIQQDFIKYNKIYHLDFFITDKKESVIVNLPFKIVGDLKDIPAAPFFLKKEIKVSIPIELLKTTSFIEIEGSQLKNKKTITTKDIINKKIIPLINESLVTLVTK